MKWAFISFLLFLSVHSIASTKDLLVSTSIYHNEDEIFIPHANALAMSIQYGPIKKLRLEIEKEIQTKLNYFTAWNPEGEAHITVITPPEYEVLKSRLSMKDINAIAQRYEIQGSRLMIMGIGHGKVVIDNKEESTYFLIVDSYNLRNIRQMVYYEFLRRGGGRKSFDPTWFFPHVTIGFTSQDLHENLGVIKNLKFSLDERFSLKFISP